MNSMSKKFLFLVCVLTIGRGAAAVGQSNIPPERALRLSIEINAPVDSVWSRWTTAPGRAKFFAPASSMEMATLGFMEILFAPQAPEGQRGAENNRVLAVQPNQLLSFTWDAPPTFPETRKQRTVVVLHFHKLSEKKTMLTFTQSGWGNGSDWDAVFDYFTKAWRYMVLPNLKYSLEVKPVDWSNFPSNLPQNLPPANEWK